MMNKLGILIGALVGTVIGGGIGWYLSQKKYTKIANEAIDEAKKEYDTAMEEAGVKSKRVFRKKEAVEKPREDKPLVETSSIQSEIENTATPIIHRCRFLLAMNLILLLPKNLEKSRSMTRLRLHSMQTKLWLMKIMK